MLLMTERKEKPQVRKKAGRPPGGNFPTNGSPIQARLTVSMRDAVRRLSKMNGTKESEEVRAAIRKHLLDAGLWPPKEAQ